MCQPAKNDKLLVRFTGNLEMLLKKGQPVCDQDFMATLMIGVGSAVGEVQLAVMFLRLGKGGMVEWPPPTAIGVPLLNLHCAWADQL